jgi:hypothetical protein
LLHWRLHRGSRAVTRPKQCHWYVARHLDHGKSRSIRLRGKFGRPGMSILFERPQYYHSNLGVYNSGLIPMIPVTLVQHPIKLSTVFLTLQQSTETTCTGAPCLISLDKDFLDALVMEKTIQVLSILMELTWDDLLLRLTCSKHRWVESL